MSDRLLRFVPDQPEWLPTSAAQDAAVAVLEAVPREDRPVEVELYDGLTLFDCGPDVAAVRCPACGADLLGTGWWAGAVDRALAEQELETTLPCCSHRGSLNDLDYDGPMAFGRFCVGVWNPETEEGLQPRVEDALGTRVRRVEARY